jgi:hypothetical protein
MDAQILWRVGSAAASKGMALSVLAYSRMIFGIVFGINSLVMLANPLWWYEVVPGVAERGAYNGHFVRDIGCASLVIGAVFFLSGLRPHFWRSAVIMSTAFIVLHASVHIGEAVAKVHRGFVMVDLLTVYLPAALAVGLAFPSTRTNAV